MRDSITIRCVCADDDLVELTEVIHLAYAKRASNNLRYWATFQSVEDTAHRLQSGQGFVAESKGRFIGTLTVRPPAPNSQVAVYQSLDTWTICQFAVHPDFQGHGIGRSLHNAAADYARSKGGQVLALDTAQPATELIEMYIRWGYKIVGEADWRPQTNYMSVVMSCPISELKGDRNDWENNLFG